MFSREINGMIFFCIFTPPGCNSVSTEKGVNEPLPLPLSNPIHGLSNLASHCQYRTVGLHQGSCAKTLIRNGVAQYTLSVFGQQYRHLFHGLEQVSGVIFRRPCVE